jgi:opacity protein-like surface antigen
VFLTGVSNPGSLDSTKIGWVAGAGLEYAVTNSWIVRGEYLYHQFAGDTFVGWRVPVLATFGVHHQQDQLEHGPYRRELQVRRPGRG